jgi:hypothetical protein
MINFKNYFLREGARIQHAEDVIFWEGSRGALRVLTSLNSLDKDYKNITLKWDGSPSIVFGRNEDGSFVFTDKNGFVAKGYDGKPTTAEALRKILLNRGGGRNADNQSYINFVDSMERAFRIFKRALPKTFRGFVKGDMLYFSRPNVYNNNYVFTPNIVQYGVSIKSDLGKRISKSEMGVVLHRNIDSNGVETPLIDYNILNGEQVLVVPTVSVEEAPQINERQINQLKDIIFSSANKVDELLDTSTLSSNQISDLPNIFYKYTNSKVDTGLESLGLDFMLWLETANLTDKKKASIKQYIANNMDGFSSLWQIVNGIMRIKDNIITQLDRRSSLVSQSIDGASGGEGYVLASTGGDIKLVPREHFSRANRARQR